MVDDDVMQESIPGPHPMLFTRDQVIKLTGVSGRQLGYWNRIGFFPPSHGPLYSFRDLCGLRTLGVLRNKHRVPLQQLRRANDWLAAHGEAPWARLRFSVLGRKVYFPHPDTGELVTVDPRGQKPLPIELKRIEADMARRIEELRRRKPSQVGKIEQRRRVMRNAPVIAGTRIPTRIILDLREAGLSIAEILQEYPTLRERDVRNAIAFEAERRAPRRAG